MPGSGDVNNRSKFTNIFGNPCALAGLPFFGLIKSNSAFVISFLCSSVLR